MFNSEIIGGLSKDSTIELSGVKADYAICERGSQTYIASERWK